MNSYLLNQALIYLAAALVCVPVARRLGFSSVLGYIAAGALIGPYALGWVGEQGQDIMHMAEFGVVMMLFVIGLELEPGPFWRLRRRILGLGGIQYVGTAVLLAAAGVMLGFPLVSAVAIGLAFAMSSTAMVLQTLEEKGVSNTSAGRSSFAVLLFQDIAVIPVLAMMPLLAIDGITQENHNIHPSLISNLPNVLKALVVLVAIALVVVLGRYVVVPMLHVVARTNVRELFIGAALFLVVGVAALMNAIGLSPALGAFLGGVVLANSAFRHELETDLMPFKSLLLGLFFIGVGCSIDFRLLFSEPGLILGLLASVLVVKMVVLFLGGRYFQLKNDQNLMFAFGLSQVGEFAFVLLAFAGELRLLEPFWQDRLMTVATLSMAVTPLLLLINERYIDPYYGTKEQAPQRDQDTVEHRHKVLIAGFGHFGSTIGRFLRANGVEATILDFDSERVDLLRSIGFNVYYGDATRLDLLKAAGAEHARIFVAAIDSPEINARLIETVRKHFPKLRVLARARNRYDAYDMLDHGVENVYRETLYTSVHLAVDAMKLLGSPAKATELQGEAFIRYDEEALKKLAHTRREHQDGKRVDLEHEERVMLSDLEIFMKNHL